jgi:hypothetical protein
MKFTLFFYEKPVCRPGFGGRRCDQCEEDFWGDPRVQCIPCNCSPLGVDPDRTQCDHVTGKCFCLEGKIFEDAFFISFPLKNWLRLLKKRKKNSRR